MAWLDAHGMTLFQAGMGFVFWLACLLIVVGWGGVGIASGLNEVHKQIGQITERRKRSMEARLKEVERMLR